MHQSRNWYKIQANFCCSMGNQSSIPEITLEKLTGILVYSKNNWVLYQTKPELSLEDKTD